MVLNDEELEFRSTEDVEITPAESYKVLEEDQVLPFNAVGIISRFNTRLKGISTLLFC